MSTRRASFAAVFAILTNMLATLPGCGPGAGTEASATQDQQSRSFGDDDDDEDGPVACSHKNAECVVAPEPLAAYTPKELELLAFGCDAPSIWTAVNLWGHGRVKFALCPSNSPEVAAWIASVPKAHVNPNVCDHCFAAPPIGQEYVFWEGSFRATFPPPTPNCPGTCPEPTPP